MLTGVAKLLLEYGAGINTHSNEFKESALTLACYKGMWCTAHAEIIICYASFIILRTFNSKMILRNSVYCSVYVLLVDI